MMLVAGFVLAVLGFEIAADLALDHEGKKSYGRVVRKFENFHTGRYRAGTSYIVAFRFQDHKGRSVIGDDAVEKELYDRIRPGQGLDILYLREYSYVHRIGAAPPYSLRAGILTLVFIVFGLAFYMVLTAFR